MLDEILTYGDKIEKLLSTFKVSMFIGIVVNIVIISILFKLTNLFMNRLKERFQSNDGSPINQIVPILGKVIKFLIVFIITASFLQSQGYSLTSLIAGFGITGLAVGFAAQQTIASMFGTIGVLADKVYKIGDYIKINGIEGVVESINLRSTKVRTLDNFLVTIPNDTAANSIVENISKAGKRRIDITFGVTYDTSDEKLQQAMNIISALVKERSDMYHHDISVFVETLDSSSINIRFLGYAKAKSFNTFAQIRSEIYLETVKRFRAEGIDFAFPSTTVYMAPVEAKKVQ
jgi:MscS family membrane protein